MRDIIFETHMGHIKIQIANYTRKFTASVIQGSGLEEPQEGELIYCENADISYMIFCFH